MDPVGVATISLKTYQLSKHLPIRDPIGKKDPIHITPDINQVWIDPSVEVDLIRYMNNVCKDMVPLHLVIAQQVETALEPISIEDRHLPMDQPAQLFSKPTYSKGQEEAEATHGEGDQWGHLGIEQRRGMKERSIPTERYSKVHQVR